MASLATQLPVLEPGDHLSGDEFDRRYARRPDIHKAELVGGVVYLPSPVRFSGHAYESGLLAFWLNAYALTRPGVRMGSDASVRLGPDDHVQPDLCLLRTDSAQVHEGDDHYLYGAPELVVEVAASSASYDLYEKKDAYAKAGVREYIVWRTHDRAIDWFVLEGAEYRPLQAGPDGLTRSQVFPGLELDIRRLLDGDEGAVLPR